MTAELLALAEQRAREMADGLLIDFYTSPAYDPHATCNGDTVKAAIQFALTKALSLSDGIREEDWQPLETAPIGESVLVWSTVYEAPVIAKCTTDRLFWEGDWEFEVRASHWQPLPAQPKAIRTLSQRQP